VRPAAPDAPASDGADAARLAPLRLRAAAGALHAPKDAGRQKAEPVKLEPLRAAAGGARAGGLAVSAAPAAGLASAEGLRGPGAEEEEVEGALPPPPVPALSQALKPVTLGGAAGRGKRGAGRGERLQRGLSAAPAPARGDAYAPHPRTPPRASIQRSPSHPLRPAPGSRPAWPIGPRAACPAARARWRSRWPAAPDGGGRGRGGTHVARHVTIMRNRAAGSRGRMASREARAAPPCAAYSVHRLRPAVKAPTGM
jgi:hypothetical protein